MIVKTVASDVGFTEGPVCLPDGSVAFTSIDRGKIYEYHHERGTSLIATTGSGPNGAALGDDGCLYVAQTGGTQPATRWPFICGGVHIVRRSGYVGWLSQDPIAASDLCFGSDGCLYVTDSTRQRDRRTGRLWHIDPGTGEAYILESVDWQPNGISFGPDNDLYVASTSTAEVMRFSVRADGSLEQGEVFVHMTHNRPDGLAFDIEGNLIIAAPGDPGDLQVIDRDGKLLESVKIGESEKYTNVAFADNGNELYVTDATKGSLLLISEWPTAGLRLFPFRAQQ